MVSFLNKIAASNGMALLSLSLEDSYSKIHYSMILNYRLSSSYPRTSCPIRGSLKLVRHYHLLLLQKGSPHHSQMTGYHHEIVQFFHSLSCQCFCY